jgi:2-haloacid dehalogenase
VSAPVGERPRALLFDVFGTLVDWRTGVIDALAQFGARRGISADWARLADDWRAAYGPAMDRVRRGEIAWRNLDALHRTSLDALFERYGLAGDDADRVQLVGAWHALPPWPDVAAGLRRLRAVAIVATLSNGNVALQVDLVRHAGLAFDMLFSAELFGHYKPDAQTYLGACALLDLAPARVMLVAAHPSDLRAARANGLRTAFVVRPLEYGSTVHSPAGADAADAAEFDERVAGLDELAQRLEA